MAVHDPGRLDGVHDALQPAPVRVVAGQVGGIPVGRRAAERVRDTGRAVVADQTTALSQVRSCR